MTLEYIRYVLRLFVVGLCTQSVWCGNFIAPSSYNLVFKPCIKDRAYRLIPNVSFSDCVRSCMLRSRCQSVMYWHLAIVCGLVDVDDVTNIVTTTGTGSICTYASVVNLDRSILGACETHNCADTQTCTVTTSGSGFTCVLSECPSVPEANNAQVVTQFQQIRGRVWYECKPNFKIVGRRTRLCQENATWSELDGGCGVTCSEPREISTANRIGVVGEQWRQNTVVMFECKPGYEDDQGNTYFNSSCSQQSLWAPRRIRCCKPGWTIITDRCWQYFNGSGFNSKEDMRIFCTQENALLMERNSFQKVLGVNESLLAPKNVNQTIINQLFVGSFSTTENMQKIQECIEDNGIVIPAAVLSGTYAGLIAFGQEQNQTSCPDIDMWAPGQPGSNSTSRTCIAYGQATEFKMITVSCIWETSGEYGLICEKENPV